MYRLQCAKCQVYIVFNAHPISGVLFVCQNILLGRTIILCTRWGAFCFSWKALEYESNGKFDEWKGEFFMMSTLTNIFELGKERRRCP